MKVKAANNHDEVYDRQIRLWGAEAQKRMSNARVLYIHLSGVSCEILKNLTLAGVAAVVCDTRTYPDAVREVPSSFFPAEEMERIIADRNTTTKEQSDEDVSSCSNHDKDHSGLQAALHDEEPLAKRAKLTTLTVANAIMPKIDELNPLLNGRNSIEERSLLSLPSSYFGEFDAIVASRLTVEEVKLISSCLRECECNSASATITSEGEGKMEMIDRNTLFIVADTFGLDGCAHLDFGKKHTYRREIGKDKLSIISKVDPYVSMFDMFDMSLSEVKTGRWDKVVPRGLILQRLLMDYWGILRLENNAHNTDGNDSIHPFEEFATQWFLSNKLSNSDTAATNHVSLSEFASIAKHPEISPVCATLGGVLGNEVIKALTGRGEPANNVVLFDGTDGGCRVYLLHGKKD